MSLDLSPEEFRQWGHAAIDAAANYVGSLRKRRLYPNTTAAAIRQKLDRQLPIEPTGIDELIRVFQDVIVDLSRQNAHPRMSAVTSAPDR